MTDLLVIQVGFSFIGVVCVCLIGAIIHDRIQTIRELHADMKRDFKSEI